MVFRKTGTASQIAHEVAGLRWLADGDSASCVMPVLESGLTWLVEPRLASKTPSPNDAAAFGAALARLHASGAESFGAAPPDAPDNIGWIGMARLPLGGQEPSWGAFYSRARIRPYLDAPFDHSGRRIILDLCELLETGALDHPQPGLVRGPAARIHGDLWAGNICWTDGGGFMIDPAAQGGHSEDDLGALSLFGAPHLDVILEAYHRTSPLAPGWRKRLSLHQMHLLMVHCHLFGGGYIGQTVEVAARVLRDWDT